MHSCAWLRVMAPRCSGRCHPDNVAPSQSRVVVTSVARRCTTEFSISLAPSLVTRTLLKYALGTACASLSRSESLAVAGADRLIVTRAVGCEARGTGQRPGGWPQQRGVDKDEHVRDKQRRRQL
jgi:hypothetical protein